MIPKKGLTFFVFVFSVDSHLSNNSLEVHLQKQVAFRLNGVTVSCFRNASAWQIRCKQDQVKSWKMAGPHLGQGWFERAATNEETVVWIGHWLIESFCVLCTFYCLCQIYKNWTNSMSVLSKKKALAKSSGQRIWVSYCYCVRKLHFKINYPSTMSSNIF